MPFLRQFTSTCRAIYLQAVFSFFLCDRRPALAYGNNRDLRLELAVVTQTKYSFRMFLGSFLGPKLPGPQRTIGFRYKINSIVSHNSVPLRCDVRWSIASYVAVEQEGPASLFLIPAMKQSNVFAVAADSYSAGGFGQFVGVTCNRESTTSTPDVVAKRKELQKN